MSHLSDLGCKACIVKLGDNDNVSDDDGGDADYSDDDDDDDDDNDSGNSIKHLVVLNAKIKFN